MLVQWKIPKLTFLLISGTFLILLCFSLSSAELLFSTDIPVSMGSTSFEEEDIIRYTEPGFSLFNIGGVALDEGVNIDAFHFNESWYKFSVDIKTSLNGTICRCMDVVHYEGGQYYKAFNGLTRGIPARVCIDAVTTLPDESIVFSVDVPVSLEGTDYQENDLIRWDGVSFSLYFDGSANGIPEGANIDGVHITPEGVLHFSLDIPVQLDGIELKESDVVGYDFSYFPAFEGVAAGLPLGADMDAVSDSGGIVGTCDCEGNFDDDEDVDGSDAFHFKVDFGRSPIGNPCENGNPCNGDFDCDHDVDGSDAFIFKEDFGRSSLSNPCPVCTRDPWCTYP